MSESFHYNYSAERQSEIDAIRKKYLPREEQENKMAKLRKLDASLTTGAFAASMALGIISALVFGPCLGQNRAGGAFVRGRCDRNAGRSMALSQIGGKAQGRDHAGDPAADRRTEPEISRKKRNTAWEKGKSILHAVF